MPAVATPSVPLQASVERARRPPVSQHVERLTFAAAPMFFAACCFALGVAGIHFIWVSPAWLLFEMLCSATVTIVSAHKATRVALLPLGCVFALLGAFCAEMARAPDPQTQLTLLADNTQKTFLGEIVRIGPLKQDAWTAPFSNKAREEQSQRIDLRISAVGSRQYAVPVSGGLQLTVYAPLQAAFPHLACGSLVRVTVAAHPPERYFDPGVWDAAAYLRGQGIGALGSTAAAHVDVLRTAQHRSPGCWLHSMQQAASGKLIAFADDPSASKLPASLRLDHEDAGMLTAMLTGDRTYLQRRVRTGFERTGSFHLLVVSGMHLAIFAGVIFWIAGLVRLPRLPATLATIGLSFGYALFTGFGQPVQRSFWMVALYLIGRLFWRERNSMNAIGFAALFLLAVDPHSLLEPSFQMTLLSVVAIADIAAPVAQKTFAPLLHGAHYLWLLAMDATLPPRVAQFRVSLRMIAEALRPLFGRHIANVFFPLTVRLALRVLELLLVSVVIELVMSMPMALYFHRITAVALPVNFLIVPFLGLLLPAALLTFAVLLLAPGAAFIPAALTAAVLHIVVFIVHTFASLRAGDMRIPDPRPIQIAAWLMLLAFSIWIVRKGRFALAITTCALVAAALVVVLPIPITYRKGTLEITAIDVGQGDSLFVITPDGKTLLIDAGGIVGESPESNFDIGEDVVSPVLWSRGIQRLDAVAITHAHEDHIGGMLSVLANFRPRQLWIGINPSSPLYDKVLAEAASLGISIHHRVAGDRFTFGGTNIHVLAPAADYHPAAIPGNDDSLVLHIAYRNTSALLEGDAQKASEARMMSEDGLHSNLLKIGHHGSITSTNPWFLSAVSPSWAAISVGRHNYYGHPRHEVLEELQASHVRTYRTDVLGASSFFLDGTRVTAQP